MKAAARMAAAETRYRRLIPNTVKLHYRAGKRGDKNFRLTVKLPCCQYWGNYKISHGMVYKWACLIKGCTLAVLHYMTWDNIAL